MTFSVLIAHYNNWNYFQECYQSIKNQTYQDYEIVLVDDYSTDESYEKLLALSKEDFKLKLFRNSENKKVGFTKRRCVEEATGEICGFLDPDDFLAPNALAEAIKIYQNNNQCIATYSKIKLVDVSSKTIDDFKQTRKIKNRDKNFFNINFEIAHFFTFKKEFYLKTEGINAKLTSAVDQDLYLKLYELGDFCFINQAHYFYRLHDKGVSQDKTKKGKLGENWHQVIFDTCKRRNIKKIYGKDVFAISNLPQFLYQKENTFLNKIKRKLGW